MLQLISAKTLRGELSSLQSCRMDTRVFFLAKRHLPTRVRPEVAREITCSITVVPQKGMGACAFLSPDRTRAPLQLLHVEGLIFSEISKYFPDGVKHTFYVSVEASSCSCFSIPFLREALLDLSMDLPVKIIGVLHCRHQ